MALQRGSTGDDVKALQQQLNAAGYNLDVDGSYGPKTQAAVKDYQTKQGLQVDGIVGSQTSASLAGLTTKSTGGSSGGTNGAIKGNNTYNGAASKWDNTDYAANAREAAAAGDWDAVNSALTTRDAKIADIGTDYGTSSMKIYQDLVNEYGGPQAQAINAQNAQLQAQIQQMLAEQEAQKKSAQNANDQLVAQLTGMVNEYKNLYDQQSTAYADALEEQKKAKQAAVDKAIGSLNTQKQTTDTAYADMFRQLYLDKMRNQKNIDQRLAAAGQTGGQAESTLLGLQTGYEDALREGGISKQAALDQINQAITDAQLTGDISAAEDAAAMAQRQIDNYAGVLADLISKGGTIASNAVQQQAAMDAENRNYAYQTAMAILQSGNMASDELLNSAGISKADASSIVAAAAAQKVAKSSGSGSGGGKTVKITKEQAGAAFNAIKNGMDTAENRAIVESYYGLPFETIVAASGQSVTAKEDSSQNVGYGANDPTLLDFQPDEGIFTWNGRSYSNLTDLANAIDAANLTDSQKAVLKNKFKIYGFDISF